MIVKQQSLVHIGIYIQNHKYFVIHSFENAIEYPPEMLAFAFRLPNGKGSANGNRNANQYPISVLCRGSIARDGDIIWQV